MAYDREPLIAEICERLAQGEPMAVICRDPHMPGVTTVWEWQQADKKIAESIARAREIGFDVIAAECLEIADDSRLDMPVVAGFDANDPAAPRGFNAEHVQRSKLRVETRLKLLAKWDPKRYGDKQQVEHSGGLTLESLVTGSGTTK